MGNNYPMPIAILEKTDNQLFEAVKVVYDLATAPGELDMKTKILVMLALDASHGASAGVKVLSSAARQLGATDKQIVETLRLAYVTAGMSALVTSKFAFEAE